MGRKPIGKKAMTAAQRQRRHRELLKYGADDFRKHLLNLASKAETAGYNSIDPPIGVSDFKPLIEAAYDVLNIWHRVAAEYEGLAKQEREQQAKTKMASSKRGKS